MNRGNRKGRIFFDDRDRRRFLRILERSLNQYGAECINYSLMENHYHSIIHTPRANISRLMALLDQLYTTYVNRRYGWTGHLFGGRFTATIIDDTDYLRNALAYIALNPVRAGLVTRAEDWEWSSYRSAIGTSAPISFISAAWLKRAFPAETLEESRRLFQVFTETAAAESTEHEVVAGNEELRKKVRALIGLTMYAQRVPRAYRALARPSLNALFSEAFTREQRRIAARRAHVVHGYLLEEIGRFLCVHPATISRWVAEKSEQG